MFFIKLVIICNIGQTASAQGAYNKNTIDNRPQYTITVKDMTTRHIYDRLISLEGFVTVRAAELEPKGRNTSYFSRSQSILFEVVGVLFILYFKVFFGIQ